MSEGRTTRVVAAIVVVFSVAVAAFTAVERREIRGRIHLRSIASARGEAVDEPLRRAIRVLGMDDPRVRELLRVERGDLEVEFWPQGPTASATPGQGKAIATAVVKNVSARRLVLFLDRSAFSRQQIIFAGGGNDLDDVLVTLPPAIVLEPREAFRVESPDLTSPSQFGGESPNSAYQERTLAVTVLNSRLLDLGSVMRPQADGSIQFVAPQDLEIEGPTVRFEK